MWVHIASHYVGHASFPAGKSLYTDFARIGFWPRLYMSEMACRPLARAKCHTTTSWVTSLCHLFRPPYVQLRHIGPPIGACEGSSGGGEAVTPAPNPRMGSGVMGCCALPTMSGRSPSEHSADLPPVYEWFGTRTGNRGPEPPIVTGGLQAFWLRCVSWRMRTILLSHRLTT